MQCKRDPRKITFVHWKKWPWSIREQFLIFIWTPLHLPGVNLNWRWAKMGSFSKLSWALQAWIQTVLALNNMWFSFAKSKGDWTRFAKPKPPQEFCPPLIDGPGSIPSLLSLFMVCGSVSVANNSSKEIIFLRCSPCLISKTNFLCPSHAFPSSTSKCDTGLAFHTSCLSKWTNRSKCAVARHLQWPASQWHKLQPQDSFLLGCLTLSFHPSNKIFFPFLWTSCSPALCPAARIARNKRTGRQGSAGWGGAQRSEALCHSNAMPFFQCHR